MCEHPDPGLVILVKEESLPLEFREERLDGAPHRFHLLEGDVFLEVRGGHEAAGLHAVVQHGSPSVVVGVKLDVSVLDGLPDGDPVVVGGDLRPPLQVPLRMASYLYGT